MRHFRAWSFSSFYLASGTNIKPPFQTDSFLVFSLYGFLDYALFGSFSRKNQEAFEDDMTYNMGQVLSIPMVLFGVFLLYKANKNARKMVSQK